MEFLDFDDLLKAVSDETIVLRKSDSSGRFLEAAKSIESGTCILTEKAAFSIDNELKQHLIVELKLPEMSVSRIFVGAMYDFIDLDKRLATLYYSQECLCEEELVMMQELEKKNPGLLKRYLMLVHNSFEVVNPPSGEKEEKGVMALKSAVYFKASFFNHSCEPNCSYSFDEATGSISVVTVRDVAPGEELTIGYCLVPEPDEDEDEDEAVIKNIAGDGEPSKPELFKRKYGFACRCACCTSSPSSNK
jgi:hypothetical protein